MEVSKAIHTKRAVRKFKSKEMNKSDVEKILNAGRRAQSAKNTQPWRFIAIQNKEILKSLSEMGKYAGHLAGAALGVAILTIDPDRRWSVMFDAGQAAAYMQLAGWELGIGSCMATIYEPEKARNLLGFPEEFHIRAAISFGYPLDENLINKPPQKGGREPFDEVIHWDKW